jgi:hypothetical protein
MTVQETVQQLQYTPLTYRIQVIELLLQSLKEEIAQSEAVQRTRKPFRVQAFDLGADVTVDREVIYCEMIQQFAQGQQPRKKQTLMHKLSTIQIDAPADLATNLDI